MRKKYTNPFMPNPYIANLHKAMRDYEIWFYMLKEGDAVEDGLTAIYAMARTLLAANPMGKSSFYIVQALQIMDATQQRGTWREDDLGAMLLALDIVHDEYPRLSPQVARRAIKEVFGVAA